MDPFLLEALLNGVLLGGVFALPALGLNLIFGVVDVVWLCYAELIMIGMYAVWFLHTQAEWPLALAFVMALPLVAVLGLLLHLLVVRPLLGALGVTEAEWRREGLVVLRAVVMTPYLAAVRLHQPGQDAQQGGFSSSVGSDQAKDLADRNLQTEVAQGWPPLKTLAQPFNLEKNHGCSSTSTG